VCRGAIASYREARRRCVGRDAECAANCDRCGGDRRDGGACCEGACGIEKIRRAVYLRIFVVCAAGAAAKTATAGEYATISHE
jgi:hypothetical protein